MIDCFCLVSVFGYMISTYDRACITQDPEFVRVFENTNVVNLLQWKQEICHHHLRRFPNEPTFLEYEARLGRWHSNRFDSTLSEEHWTQLHQLISQSEWFQRLDTDLELTQDMFFAHPVHKYGVCRTRICYYKNKPMTQTHIWKRKLTSVVLEPRRPQTPDVTELDPLAIRIVMSQELPVSLGDTQIVQTLQTRFKWTHSYEYKSPDTGLQWHYHFSRVLEGKTKCDVEKLSNQLTRFLRYECECECVNFLQMYKPVSIHMTPTVYLFCSLLTKLNDWIRQFVHELYLYECVGANVFVSHINELYSTMK